jgi:hypothetical protein
VGVREHIRQHESRQEVIDLVEPDEPQDRTPSLGLL